MNNILNKEFPQKCGDSLKVIEKSNFKTNKGESLFKCIFKIKSYEVYAQKYQILNGSVINPFFPNIFKQGYVGIGKYQPIKYNTIFNCCYGILIRCYNKKDKKYKIYGFLNITICEEWKCFQNFAAWYEENSKWNVNNNYLLNIDKDILANISHLENKIYSPETCLLIPADLNGFIAGDCLECGINKYKLKDDTYNFYPRFKTKHLGTFSIFKEAKEIYAKEKYFYWCHLINNYIIPNNLREILLKYDFSWYWKYENL